MCSENCKKPGVFQRPIFFLSTHVKVAHCHSSLQAELREQAPAQDGGGDSPSLALCMEMHIPFRWCFLGLEPLSTDDTQSLRQRHSSLSSQKQSSKCWNGHTLMWAGLAARAQPLAWQDRRFPQPWGPEGSHSLNLSDTCSRKEAEQQPWGREKGLLWMRRGHWWPHAEGLVLSSTARGLHKW